MKSILSSGKIIVAIFSEIEKKLTVTSLKHVNRSLVNVPQKMRLKTTMETLLLREEGRINNEEVCWKSRSFEKEKNMIIDGPYYESEKLKNMNNEFKVNVDEQQGDIKHLKEYWQIVQIKNGIKQSYGYSIWINLSWMTGKTGVNT